MGQVGQVLCSQHDESSVVVDNIHAIIAAAAIKFNAQQLENLFVLIQKVFSSCITSSFDVVVVCALFCSSRVHLDDVADLIYKCGAYCHSECLGSIWC